MLLGTWRGFRGVRVVAKAWLERGVHMHVSPLPPPLSRRHQALRNPAAGHLGLAVATEELQRAQRAVGPLHPDPQRPHAAAPPAAGAEGRCLRDGNGALLPAASCLPLRPARRRPTAVAPQPTAS